MVAHADPDAFRLAPETAKTLTEDAFDFALALDMSASAADKLGFFIARNALYTAGMVILAIQADRAGFSEAIGPRVTAKLMPQLRAYVVANAGAAALLPAPEPALARALEIPRVSAGKPTKPLTLRETVQLAAAARGVPHALEVHFRALSREAFVAAGIPMMRFDPSAPATVGDLLESFEHRTVGVARASLVKLLEQWMEALLEPLRIYESFLALEDTPLPEGSPFAAADALVDAAVRRSSSSREWPWMPWSFRVDSGPGVLVIRPSARDEYFSNDIVFSLESWPRLGDDVAHKPAGALRALRRLFRSPDDPALAALLAWVQAPRWPRFFELLDRSLQRVPKPLTTAGDTRLAFRLQLTARHVGFDFALQKQGRGGAWSRGAKPGRDFERDVESIADAADRRVLDAFAVESRGESYRFAMGRLKHYGRIFDAALGHPRVFVNDAPTALRRVTAAVEFVEVGRELEVRIRLGRHTRMLAEVTLCDDEPLVLDRVSEPGVLAFAHLPHAAHRLLSTFRDRPTSLPEASWPELLKRLETLGSAIPAILPPDLEGEPLEIGVTPVIEFAVDDASALSVGLAAQVHGHVKRLDPGEGSPRLYVQIAGKRHVIVRDLDGELAGLHATAAALSLADRAVDPVGAGRSFLATELDAVLGIIESAEKLGDRVEVRWASSQVRLHGPIGSGAVRLRVGAAGGYLTIGGDATVDEETVALLDIAGAVRRGDRFVRVAPGHFARISEELRAKLAPVADVAKDTKGGLLEVAAAALPFIGELVEATSSEKIQKNILTRLEQWRSARTASFDPPEHLRAVLRPYQAEGFAWLARLAAWGSGAILADDMGLGKTVQAIALLEHRAPQGPALVIAPTSVGPNWESELARFGVNLRVRVYRGPHRALELENLGKNDVLVTSWDLAVRDEETLSAIPFATVVFDEAQSAKNAATRRATMACNLQASFRLALSGTPIENHLGELWSIFSFTLPGLLGTKEQFRQRFASPIERDHSSERREVLAALVKPFVLRRTKELVEKDLPSLTETTSWVELSGDERLLYEAMRREALASLEAKVGSGTDQILFLSWLTRLRQMACHPRLALTSSEVPSSKLAAVVEVIDALRAEKHRMLVFSQFTQHLALVRAELEAARVPFQYLDGSTPADQRKRSIEAFQKGEGEVFLLSLKAGGVGINLTAASHVLHLDPWWNPAVEEQATDRAHRIGQTKPVTSIRFVSRGTVEEAIVGVRERKRELAAAVLDGTDVAAKLSQAELLDLMRAGFNQD